MVAVIIRHKRFALGKERSMGGSGRDYTLNAGDSLHIDDQNTVEILSVDGVNVEADPINPDHYRSHPSGVECITITEHFDFCLGNAVKYIWRAALKGGIEDLKKARWYLDREISRLECSNET